MNRRDTVIALLALCAAPLSARAQQLAKIPRVGLLSLEASNGIHTNTSQAFRRGLRELGYVEGKNVVIDWRYADNRFERLAELAAELVQLKVDIIVTGGTPAIAAAQKATATIPIVMATSGDPVRSGFVKSLAQPGTNITGLTIITADIVPKRLEFLLAIVPKLARVSYLSNPANQVSGLVLESLQVAARKVGINVFPVEVRSVREMENAFVMMKKQNAGAVIVGADSLFNENRNLVASVAAKHRLPCIYNSEEYVPAGGTRRSMLTKS